MADHDLGGYVEVKDRIRAFRDKHEHGSLQPANPSEPYRLEFIEVLNSNSEPSIRCMIVYTAAAYRTPDDPRPGIGIAWEPFPGLTPFTRNSELMNAETSAWGRAIVACLAADADAPIATGEDVAKRRAEDGSMQQSAKPKASPSKPISEAQVKLVHVMAKKAGVTVDQLHAGIGRDFSVQHIEELNAAQASELIDRLKSKAEK